MEDSGQTSDSVFIETSSSIDPHVSQHIPQTPIQTDNSNAFSPVETTLDKLLPQGEVLEAQREHPLYLLGKSLPTVPGLQI